MAFTQMQCLLIPSDEERGERVANKRPSVKITGGVFTSDSAGVDYRVDFRWHGWDDDGVVTTFEWAIDDTTLERAWQTTSEFGGIFRFRASTDPGTPVDPRFFDWHRFFIRAVDNEFARSKIDSRFFNAKTIAPETRITFPPAVGDLIRRPRTFNVTWEGEDLDSTKPEKTPDFYEYKLVGIEFGDDPVDALLEEENVFLDTLAVGDRTAWIRIPSEITTLRLTELTVPNLFVFGIRAVDEAGAIEPSLDQGDNYFVFEVTDEECRPIVTIAENRLGFHRFPDNGPVWTVEVPSNSPLRFRWEGDAEFCGSRPGNVNYGLDLEDPGNENLRSPDGIGGWIGWGNWEQVQRPFSFPDRDDGKTHNFYVKMRDESNDPRSERFCWIQIKVVAFPFNSTILIVDDASPPRRFGGTDAEHDAVRDEILGCAWDLIEPGEEVGIFNMYGDNELGVNANNIPLSLVAQYKLIVWNAYFFGRIESGLTRNEFRRKVLSNYVGAGGRLYLFGSKPIGGLSNDNYGDFVGDGLCPDVQGVDSPAFDEENFIWKFLHIRNCIRSTNSARQRIDGWAGARAVHPLYPDLDIDPEVWDPYEIGSQGEVKGGVIAFEIYKKALVINSPPDPGMDTIYAAKPFEYQGQQSAFDGMPNAVRYESTPEDSALNIDHGRVFLQMFDFLFVDEGPAREAACKVMTWMLTGRDE
jgi:hypothetical protein